MFFAYVRDLLLHVLFPRVCFACGRDMPFGEHAPLCQNCEKALRFPGPLVCRRCGVPLKDGGAHCFHCRGSKADGYACKIIRSAWVFSPVSRGVIHALKYSGYTQVADYLGAAMLKRFKTYPELASADVLVPVPLHPKKERQRGYNQSVLLARSFGRRLGLPVLETALARCRNTPSQTKLNRSGRLTNMDGAFVCTDAASVKGKIVLLVDDVATTGATLEGCARALRAGGAKRVMAYTLAREP